MSSATTSLLLRSSSGSLRRGVTSRRVLQQIVHQQRRCLAMKDSEDFLWKEPIPESHTLESVPPPPSWVEGGPPKPDGPDDPASYIRKPVTSAHMIDLESKSLSARDSAAISPQGTVMHGRYGDLGVVEGVPLEYLALLRPAAEGVAAVKAVGASSGKTLLVFGASQAAGLAATQMAATEGCAVIAVVGGEHSGNYEFMDAVKGVATAPGCVVPEELAMVKQNFKEIVAGTVTGDKCDAIDTATYLEDFKTNVLAYAKAFPNTRPAAVPADALDFYGKEKDREKFRDNLDPYLEQFTPGSPPIDPAALDEKFNLSSYKAFKAKFNSTVTAIISGDYKDGVFNAAEEVSNMTMAPEAAPAEYSEYEFQVDRPELPTMPMAGGGPICGALIVPTPDLVSALEKSKSVLSSKSLRAKAEQMQFLTLAEQHAIAAANSVVSQAKAAGAPVYSLGGPLPGMDVAPEPSDVDVKEAIAAMDVDHTGTSPLNFFVRAYRAGDYPVYADLAIHRALEYCAGPRQYIVTV